MATNTLTVIPGYQLGNEEILSVSIINQMAKPTVELVSDEPFNDENYFRNGNFYGAFWTTPSGINCPAGSQTTNAGSWFCQPNGTGIAVFSQSTNTPDLDSLYSAKILGATGITDVLFGQQINFDLSATLRRIDSFSGWIYNNTSSAFTPTVQIATANAQGSFAAVTVQAELGLPSCPPNAWTFVSVSQDVSAYANVSNGLQVSFHIPTGVLGSSSNFVLFARLKAQVGNVATDFADDISMFTSAPTINTSNIANGAVTSIKIAPLTVSGGTPSGNIAPNTIVGGVAVSCTANTTISSNQVVLVDPGLQYGFRMAIGDYINGPGIPVNSTVTNISSLAGPTVTLTISSNATASATGVAITVGAGNFIPGYLTAPCLVNNPLTPPASSTQWDDEFDGNFILTKWSGSLSGTGNAPGIGGSRLTLMTPGVAGYMQEIQSFSLSTGVPFQFTVEVELDLYVIGAASAGPQVYIGLVGGSKSLCAMIGWQPGSFSLIPSIAAYRGVQTTGGTAISGFNFAQMNAASIPRFVRFGYDGTNLYLSVSADGFNFFQFYSEVYSSGVSFGGSAVNDIVLGVYLPNPSGQGIVSFDFIRKTI